MELRKRDKLVIEALINQDYCFYKDICRKFYPYPPMWGRLVWPWMLVQKT